MPLVLTRIANRDGQDTIRIGDDILITVSDIRGNQVRVTVDAPRDVHILREELFRRMSNKAAKHA
jgi:carbon storage regulator